jgi:hypothetical protein
MENTTKKVTESVVKKLLELNVVLKEHGLSKFSFELNKHGYLTLTEQPSNSNPTLAVLTEFDEEQALDWLSKHESFNPLYQPLMDYLGTDSYAKHITRSIAYPIGKWSDFNLDNGSFQYRLKLLGEEKLAVTIILNSSKDLSEVETHEDDLEIMTFQFPVVKTKAPLFHTTITMKFETTFDKLLSSLKLAEEQLLAIES